MCEALNCGPSVAHSLKPEEDLSDVNGALINVFASAVSVSLFKKTSLFPHLRPFR